MTAATAGAEPASTVVPAGARLMPLHEALFYDDFGVLCADGWVSTTDRRWSMLDEKALAVVVIVKPWAPVMDRVRLADPAPSSSAAGTARPAAASPAATGLAFVRALTSSRRGGVSQDGRARRPVHPPTGPATTSRWPHGRPSPPATG